MYLHKKLVEYFIFPIFEQRAVEVSRGCLLLSGTYFHFNWTDNYNYSTVLNGIEFMSTLYINYLLIPATRSKVIHYADLASSIYLKTCESH